MNVLYVCADRGIPLLGGKGASVHVRSITSAIQRLGHRVTLAVHRLGEGNPAPPVYRVVELAGDPDQAGAQLTDLARRDGIDLVIERYSLQSGAARAASRECALPFVLEVNAPLVREATRHRGLDDAGAQSWEEGTLRSADRVHVVSTALLRYVRSVAPDVPVQWIPNGVDVQAFRVPAEQVAGLAGRTVVGFSGSMKPWHGVGQLLDAFAALAPARPEAALLLVGGGPAEEAARARAGAPDLAGRVWFTGPVPHERVAPLLARFDIATAPYLPDEDFYFNPLKVVEYLAAGRPVVYAQQGDLPELVGPAGLGYPPGCVEALADRLDTLLGDGRLRRRLADEASGRAGDLDWASVARRLLRFASST